jgi:hypothetical protein
LRRLGQERKEEKTSYNGSKNSKLLEYDVDNTKSKANEGFLIVRKKSG